MAQLPMYVGIVNSPLTELAESIDATETTITLTNGDALPDAPNLATIGAGESAETIEYTAKNGNELSGITRGFQGTARQWVAGTKVARRYTDYDHGAFIANIGGAYQRADQAELNAKAYTDDQIQLVTETGIPKLVSYQFKQNATVDNQTVFEVPLDLFDTETDTLLVYQNTTYVNQSRYTVTNTVQEPTFQRGFITLNDGVESGTEIVMIVLKNVPIGEDGAINGAVLAVESVPQNRVVGLETHLNETASDDVHGLGALNDYIAMDDRIIQSELNVGTSTTHDIDISGLENTSFFIHVFVRKDDFTMYAEVMYRLVKRSASSQRFIAPVFEGGAVSGGLLLELTYHDQNTLRITFSGSNSGTQKVITYTISKNMLF